MSERDLNPMFDSFIARARLLEDKGCRSGRSVRVAFTRALAANDRTKALHILERAERLYAGTYTQWVPVRDLLSRAEVLRSTSEELGINPSPLPDDFGNPRAIIRAGPLSAELFRTSRKIANDSIAVLRKSVLQHGKEEAVKLGASIQAAQRRGENVDEATTAFRSLLQTLKTEPSPILVERISTCRKLVSEIPSAPAIAFPEIEDADEILLEARILARRIHRIKRNARDAQSAARLMSHVPGGALRGPPRRQPSGGDRGTLGRGQAPVEGTAWGRTDWRDGPGDPPAATTRTGPSLAVPPTPPWPAPRMRPTPSPPMAGSTSDRRPAGQSRPDRSTAGPATAGCARATGFNFGNA